MPSQIGQRLVAPTGLYLELLRIFASSRFGFAWVLVDARFLFAVAVGAKVKNRVRVVVTCQIPPRVGTLCAELHFHMQPSQAKQRTSVPAQVSVVEGAGMCFSPPVLRRLRLICSTEIANILVTCNRLFRSATRLGEWGLSPQSYVGKRVA